MRVSEPPTLPALRVPYAFRFFFHRASAAFFAISRRLLADNA